MCLLHLIVVCVVVVDEYIRNHDRVACRCLMIILMNVVLIAVIYGAVVHNGVVIVAEQMAIGAN